MPDKKLPKLPFEKIAQLTKVQRILICVGTFLLLGGLFFYLIYMPKSTKLNELKNNYDSLETRLLKAKADASKLPKLRKEYKEAQGKFRLVLQLLPDKKEIPSLLENVSNSGRRSGLEFLLFQPTKEVLRDFYAEIPVKIQVSGGYHNLAMFFDKVARLSRIVNVSNISMKKAGKANLKTSCTAITYRFVEKAKKKKKGGKKK